MTCYNLAAAAFLLSVPAFAAPPDPKRLLMKAMEPPAVAYEGEMAVVTLDGARKKIIKKVSVRYLPPGRYRREISDESGQIQLIVSDGKTEWIHDKKRSKVWKGEAADPFYKRLGPDEEQELLAANYNLSASTGENVAGRPTWKLDVRSRSDAALSRLFWVDQQQGLILQGQVFQPGGLMVSSLRFKRIAIPSREEAGAFQFRAPAGLVPIDRLSPDYLALEEVRNSGPSPEIPSWLPSGYVFESLDILPYRGKKIIHYRYSDGINVLSLFQCPPRSRMNFGKNIREKVRLASAKGTLSWSDEGNILSWSSKKNKLVLIAPLTPDVLKKIADSVK